MAGEHHRDDLGRDRQFSLAMLKLVEIIGEAANRISTRTQQAHPQVPWRRIIGTRHRLIHGYDDVDHDILWDIIKLDLPPLIEQLQAIVSDEA